MRIKRLPLLAPLLALTLCMTLCSSDHGEETPAPAAAPAAPTGLVLFEAAETSLTFQWNRVDGAETYAWTLLEGGTQVRGGETAARNVKISDLNPGTAYVFGVRAVGSGGTSAESRQEAATKGNAGPTPAPDPQEWDFSSTAWQSALETDAASAKGSNQTGWTVSVDGLTYTSGSKNGKWDASGYIQPNGAGSTTERVFTFTAPADGKLIVTACSAKSGEARAVAVKDAGGEERTQSVDALADLEFEIAAGEVAIYPKAGIRFYKIAYQP